jgi:hypothetical protein
MCAGRRPAFHNTVSAAWLQADLFFRRNALHVQEVSVAVVIARNTNSLARILANLLCVLQWINLLGRSIVQGKASAIFHALECAIFGVARALRFHHVVVRIHLGTHFVHDFPAERAIFGITDARARHSQTQCPAGKRFEELLHLSSTSSPSLPVCASQPRNA